MTAKTLSWVTFGVLSLGALPFVANASVASAVSSDLVRGGIYSGGITPVPLPKCGFCGIKPNEEFSKTFAVDRNALCPADKPYRVWVRLTTKVYCEGGVYFLCDDTSSMECGVYVERPSCPSDTCARS